MDDLRSRQQEMPMVASRRDKIRLLIPYIVIFILFAIWMIFLIFITSGSSRNVTYYDALNQQDVSSDYTSTIPLERYLIEPLVAVAFTLAADPLDFLLVYLIGYVVLRLAYLLIARFIARGSQKKEFLLNQGRSVFNFTWKYQLITFGILAMILLIGYQINGFHFVNLHFRMLIQILIIISLILFVGKITWNVIMIVHPKMKIKLKRKKKWKDLLRKSPRYWGHKVFDVIGRESRYGLSFLLMFLISCFGLMSLSLPTQKTITNLGPNEYLFDFHVHTIYSDGSLSPEQRIDWYISQGINGAVFTDHDNL